MSKIELEKTIGQIAQSIGTFNSTLITLKKGQDEVKDALMMFREMINGMGNDLNQIHEVVSVVKVVLPRLIKDAKAAQHKRKIKADQQARYRASVVSKNACVDTTKKAQNVDTTPTHVDTTKESEKDKEEISPHTPLIGEREKEKENCVCIRAREDEGEVAAWFAQFWADYPKCGMRKRDKAKCCRKFTTYVKKAKDPKAFFDALMRGLDRWKQSSEWMRGFVCAPLVWLNNERWETDFGDDPEKADKRKPFVGFNGGIRGDQFGSRDHATNYLPPTQQNIEDFALPKGV